MSEENATRRSVWSFKLTTLFPADSLENVYASSTHAWLWEIPAIEILRRVWIQQYHASEQETPWRKDQELAP
jgi:hypothetical protein